MGWTYYTTYGKTDRLEECRKTFGKEPTWATIIKDALVDDVYYAAMKLTKTGEVWALIALTDIADGEFGYKDMDETMHPYYYDCPNSILNLLSSTNNELANTWRKLCRANKNKRKPIKPKQDPLDELRKYLNYVFSSDSTARKDYLSFQTKYINYLRKFCLENGWELTKAVRGHYYFSCFIRNAENKYVYLSIDDVRGFKANWYFHVLIRRADSDTDYHGHGNNYTQLDDLQENISRLFRYE